jgi:hypothetical protein
MKKMKNSLFNNKKASMNIFGLVVAEFVGALVLTLLLVGLRSTAAKTMYDAASAFNVTDSQNVNHVVAAGPVSGDTAILFYMLGIGLIWVIFGVLIVYQLVAKFKHKG